MSDLISRQAAIERFDYIRPRDPMTSDYTHGIDVGIALCKVAIREQPPAQLGTNLASLGTDCISREQAIDAVRATLLAWSYMPEWRDNKIIEAVKQLPSIQPKRGRWHYSDGKPARIGLSFGVVCDQCGTESEYCTNFCGECGADMREVTT